MKALRAMFVRFAGLFRKKQHEAEMNEELRGHLDALTERNIAAGMPPDAARYAALRTFGGVAQIAERARDERRSPWGEHLLQDVRHAARALRKNPAFTLVAVASLAIAIGANTAIFGLLEAMVFRPLPVRAPHELILLGWERTGEKGGSTKGEGGDIDRGEINPANGQPIRRIFSWQAFEHVRAARGPLTDVFAVAPLWQPHLSVDGVSERLGSAHLVSGNHYAALGVTAVVGRVLRPDDDRPEAPPVIVISHRHWQRRFAGDSSVVGKSVLLNRTPVTIVGVTPPGFVGAMLGGGPVDVTVPLALAPLVCPEADEMPMRDPGFWWLRVMGRLERGATPEQARASLEGVFLAAAREGWNTPDQPPRLVATSAGHGRGTHQRNVGGMLPLVAMGALLLLVACANLANLLLARGAARRREFAVRLALGAGRGRLVRQLLAESVLVALAGAAAGILFAAWGLDLLTTLIPPKDAPDLYGLQLDWRVAGFTAALALSTAVLFGLVPALRATRLDLTAEFQGGTRTLGRGARSKLSQSLMVAQVALSLVLLVMAGLLVRTVHNLRSVDIGFDHDRLALFSLEAVPAGYAEGPRLAAFYRDAAEAIRAIPGVRGATYSRTPVLSQHGTSRAQFRSAEAAAAGVAPTEVGSDQLEPRFFETYRMAILGGRGFTERDDATSPKVVVINQALAQKFFPRENPLGRRVQVGRRKLEDAEIVGVVRDFRQTNFRRATLPAIYAPVAQSPVREAHFAVRTDGPPEILFAALRKAVGGIDAAVPLANLRTQDQQIEWNLAEDRIFAQLATFFGLAALALASVGLYGLMSYGVMRRTGEIGLRMALGAVPRQVLALILRESFRLVLLGVALGIVGAFGAVRVVRSLLYGLTPTDPVTYAVAAGVLMIVASLAALLPARRAAKIDPMVALRAE
jgi:predicted permease